MLIPLRQSAMLKIGARNIWLNWRHSIATISAIALGFSAVALFDGFMSNMRHFVVETYVNRSMMGHVVIQRKGAQARLVENPWTFAMNRHDQEVVAKVLGRDPRVVATVRFLQLSGVISNGSASPIFVGIGYDVQEGLAFRGQRWMWNTAVGVPLHLADESSFLMGLGLARRLDCQLNDSNAIASDGSYKPERRPFDCPVPSAQISVTTENSQVNALSLKPVGGIDFLMREYNDRLLTLPMPVAQRLLDTESISRFSVLLKDPGLTDQFVQDFQSQPEIKSSDIEAFHWLKHPAAAAARGGLEILGIFRTLFLTVVIVIAAMSVANTMMKSINERIREIGMLRSLGYRQNDIILMFSAEGLFLGLISCAIGLVLTLLLAWGISLSGITFKTGVLSSAMPLRIDLSILTWIFSALVLCLITAGTSWLVSRRTARMVVAETLRYVA